MSTVTEDAIIRLRAVAEQAIKDGTVREKKMLEVLTQISKGGRDWGYDFDRLSRRAMMELARRTVEEYIAEWVRESLSGGIDEKGASYG